MKSKKVNILNFKCVLCKKTKWCVEFKSGEETINQSLGIVKVIYTHLCKDCIKQMYNQIKQK